ncbi:MAG: hypothetical protein ABII03_06225 [Nanoarchaeota archaeon]|nr:hypothetical protein [Nanoarchaeota archaeon]
MVDIFSISGFYRNIHPVVDIAFGGFFRFGKGIGDSPFENDLFGNLVDSCGGSTIKGIMAAGNTLNFSKAYDGEEEIIDYDFRFDTERGLWIGGYRIGQDQGRAICKTNRCFERLGFENPLSGELSPLLE